MAEATTTMAQPQPIYLTIPQNSNSQTEKERIEKLFPKKTMLACSILQLICAGSAALMQVTMFNSL